MPLPVPPSPVAAWGPLPVRWGGRAAAAVFVAALSWLWWCTASSTSIALISSLFTVEPYAFAVHEQLIANFHETGRFFQTVHKGYDDAWTWSGHRALTLPLAGLLYGLSPSPFGLARLLVAATLLGVVPAALLGRRAAGSDFGAAAGALAYLGAPPVMAMALQGYQDLAFAVPALVFAWWAMGSRWWLVAMVGVVVAMAPREECVPMAVGIAGLALPWAPGPPGRPWWRRLRWVRWLGNIVGAAALAGAYVSWAQATHPISGGGHDMPLENALRSILSGDRAVFLDGWPWRWSFYGLLAVPLGGLLLLGGEALLPAVALVVLHMTVPVGHGVDRSWSGHAHHMAPAAAFAALAGTLGAGRLLRLVLPRRGPARALVGLVVVGGLLAVCARSWGPWADEQNLVVATVPTNPTWVHPAWTLAEKIPADAVPVATKDTSLVVSRWSRSYTADGSLATKAAQQGLAAATHMIVDERQTTLLAWAKAMPGATVVARVAPFVLIGWEPGPDPRWSEMRGARITRPPPYTGSHRRRQDIPGVPPHAGGQSPTGPVPRLQAPWSDSSDLPPLPPGDPTTKPPRGAAPAR